MNPALSDWKLRRLDLTLNLLFIPVLISGSVIAVSKPVPDTAQPGYLQTFAWK